MENRCVCCGAIIPEGRQVCPKCEWFIKGCEEMRNGVVHRIEKIHQITGLDPTDFWDLYKLVQMVKERAAEDGK